MWPGNRLGTARAGFAAGYSTCAIDDFAAFSSA
jgi:hypothetical protein